MEKSLGIELFVRSSSSRVMTARNGGGMVRVLYRTSWIPDPIFASGCRCCITKIRLTYERNSEIAVLIRETGVICNIDRNSGGLSGDRKTSACQSLAQSFKLVARMTVKSCPSSRCDHIGRWVGKAVPTTSPVVPYTRVAVVDGIFGSSENQGS